MFRSGSVFAFVALAIVVAAPAAATLLTPAPAIAQEPSLAFPRSSLEWLPDRREAVERGIEDATSGVWIGGAAGVVAGGLLGSWAFCGLGEGDCGFSITAAGPGMLIGGILGASIGGLLDRDARADGGVEPAYDEELAAAYREELRSYREEQAATDAGSARTAEELTGSDAFLGALAELSAGVIVVDRELNVLAWNRTSEELWGLRAEETDGVSLEALDFGLPVGEIRDEIRASARGRADRVERDLEAVDRRGETILVRVRIVPFSDDEGRRHGAVILVDERTG